VAVWGASLSALAQQNVSTEPFVRDAVIGPNSRCFYIDVEDNSKPPSSTQKRAWALSGKLFGRTGYWNDTL